MSNLLRTTVITCTALSLAAGFALAQAPAPKKGKAAVPAPERKPDIHFVPTPQAVVDEMLRKVELTKNDLVYDLGCGDGRIVITAAQKYGARGIGIDIDPQRIIEAKENAEKAGVTGQVQFKIADIYKSNFSDANVIALYLLTSLNERLRPKIFAETKPGTRIVSHSFSMGPWQADDEKDVTGHHFYYWVVPANMSGTWKVAGHGQGAPRKVTINQVFQKVTGTLETPQGTRNISGKVNGAEFALKVDLDGGQSMDVTGKITDDRIEATTSGDQPGTWSAEREKGTKADISVYRE